MPLDISKVPNRVGEKGAMIRWSLGGQNFDFRGWAISKSHNQGPRPHTYAA